MESKYYVLTMSDVVLKELDNKEALIEELRRIREEERTSPCGLKAAAFLGNRIHISKGEFKYILFPDGTKEPLYVPTDIVEPDEDGTLVDVKLPVLNSLAEEEFNTIPLEENLDIPLDGENGILGVVDDDDL